MTLHLHNTATRHKDAFTPLDPEHVRLYVCGPTVYDRIHIGNARPLIVFDALARLLRHRFPRVSYVRNITDIDDKIMARAGELGVSVERLTEDTAASFQRDATALGVAPPDVEPRATAHLPEMRELIETLIARGFAYTADGHVLFHVPANPDYGWLSNRSRDEQVAGARVEVASYKRDPADFVLWKPSTDAQPGWDSPWGRGRPGWHLECSAMSEKYLGLPFDIHGGGLDLIFPHHENEIAQSCCARGVARMARYWVHNGYVTVNGEKMSKSLGNFTTVEDALATVPGEALRLWTLGTHYRSPLDYADEAVKGAKATLDRFYGTLDRLAGDGAGGAPDAALLEALEDDLNTPKALSVLHELIGAANKAEGEAEQTRLKATIIASGALLGLLQQEPQAWLKGAGAGDGPSAAIIEELIEARKHARKGKDFARADAIRDDLKGQGVELMDGPAGTTWRRL